LAAVFVDYLQLVRPSTLSRQANRNEELSEICRTLKATAKDLEVPIIALAQLNRAVEMRAEKRPMLSDLRDCLAGESLVTNAETGERVPIRDIAERGLRFDVWAVDERMRLVRRPIVDAWSVGTKPVFRVTTKSGRVVRCTAGHRFLTIHGWSELRDIQPGRAIAVPRRYENRRATNMSRGLPAASREQGAATSHSPAAMVAERIDDAALTALLAPDVVWDPITAIEPEGSEIVYDLTVGDLHNFCVDDVVTHNSGAIEQEADIVAFLYRDVYYNKEATPEPDLTELIIAKHRNGKVGTVKLRFQPEHTLFVPYGDDSHYPAP
jgi:replicative DNA helicase